MNAKKIVGSVFGVGAIIVSSVLLKKVFQKKLLKLQLKLLQKRNFVEYLFQN